MEKKIPCIKCNEELFERLWPYLEKWGYNKEIVPILSWECNPILVLNYNCQVGNIANVVASRSDACDRELVADPEEFLARAAELKGFEYKPNNSKPMSNILERANQIVNHRAEEKDRQYGSFSESIERAAKMYNLMSSSDEQITPEGVFKVLVALKLSREAYNHKEDNLLDAVAYLGALNNYREQQNNLVNETE